MSILAIYYRITSEQLEQMKQDLAGFEHVQEQTWQPDFESRMLDLGKAWDGVHFLVAGCSLLTYAIPRNARELSDLESIVAGGTQFDHQTEEAAYFSPSQVVQIANALQTYSVDDVKENFNLEAFANADLYFFGNYLPITEEEREEYMAELDEELFQYYEETVEFFNEAARNGDAVFLKMG